jgi:two-component system phosphate regulon sensor histidine kinase PhoR
VSPEALALDFLDSGRLIARARLRSFAAAPMVLGGQVSGAIAAASRTASAYSQADLDALEMIAALVAGAVANAGRAAAELDLSEHRDLVLRLEADTRDLQAAREERTHFISNVSHEFKAPLTAVVAFADILARNRERTLTEKQLEHIRTIQRNASRLNLMVTDLLDMTRIDSGTFSLRKSRTDACAIADEVVQGIRPTLARKKQRLVLIKGRDHVPVLADHDRLAQILTNLLDNASKYSEERKELRLSVHVNGEWLHLSVEDQGVGIPPSALADVFRPFFRVDNESTRSVPGTGLGLAIVKRIAEMHGGSVDIKSVPGRGTTVHAALPVVIRE